MGDEESDPALMEFLGAEMKKESGQFFKVDPTWQGGGGDIFVSGLGDPSAASPGARQAGVEGVQGGARCQSWSDLLFLISWDGFVMFGQPSI